MLRTTLNPLRRFGGSVASAAGATASFCSSSAFFTASNCSQTSEASRMFSSSSFQPLRNSTNNILHPVSSPRMFESRRFDASGDNEDINVDGNETLESDSVSADSDNNPQAFFMIGFVLTAGGIILINLNERRAAKQDLLDDAVEPLVVSITDPTSANDKNVVKFNTADDLDGLIFHAFGDVEATEPWPRDPDLGVSIPKSLRLSRRVEMYQWKEHREEHKDKNGNKHVSYTYTKEWSSHRENTRDSRNPTFPKFSPIREAGELNMIVPNRPEENKEEQKVKLHLSSNFVQRVTDFEPVNDLQAKNDFEDATRRGYRRTRGVEGKSGQELLYKGSDEYSPEIGDVRVSYRYVPPGEYTSLGFYDKKKGIEPVRGKLKETLAKSHGDLVVPEKAHELAEKYGKYLPKDKDLDTGIVQQQEIVDEKTGEKSTKSVFTLPEWLIEPLEQMMLSATPIEFAFLQREHVSKAVAIEHNRDNQFNTTQTWWYIGLAACAVGGAGFGAVTASFLPASIGGYSTLGGLSTGLLIGRQTREGARAQLEELKKKEIEMNKVSKAIRSKKEKGVFEL